MLAASVDSLASLAMQPWSGWHHFSLETYSQAENETYITPLLLEVREGLMSLFGPSAKALFGFGPAALRCL